MTDLSEYSEYQLFRHFGKTTTEIAAIKGIPEHEADRRRLQQARDSYARHRTSRFDCQGENIKVEDKGQKSGC